MSDCTATITSRCLQAHRTNYQINEMYDIQTMQQPNLSLNLKLFPDVELAQLGSSCKTLPADQRQQHPGGSQPGSATAAWQWNRPRAKATWARVWPAHSPSIRRLQTHCNLSDKFSSKSLLNLCVVLQGLKETIL